MTKGNQFVSLANIRARPSNMNMQDVCRKCFGTEVLSKLPLPDNLEAVYDTQVWSMRQDHTFVGLTPHGVMEARLLVSGCEHILAIPVSLLPGQTLAEKRARLTAANRDLLTSYVRGGGGAYKHEKPGELVLIPSGMMVMMAGGAQDSTGLRWGVYGGDNARVKQMVECLVASWSDLGTVYGPWLDYLRS